ncbi:Protein required for ethanol metabolism [Pleosporales sp. CAS-2024a]
MAFRWYQAKLKSAPLLTQAITTGVLFSTGDVMAQQLVEKRGFAQHDPIRTARMGAYGGFIFGPAATKWYGFLTKNVNLSGKNSTIVARVACDQLLFAPVNMGLFLSSMAYLEGASVQKRLQDAYVPGLTKNFMIWPWVQFTNFKYVPMEHRVLVVNIISLGWNCYLSYLNSGGGSKPNLPKGHTKEGGELPPS